MKPLLPNAVSQRGASMGRSASILEPSAPIKFRLYALQWVDGDYDEGGAYWGYVRGENIYRAIGEGPEFVNEMFVRAKSREEAKAGVLKEFKNARFYR